MTALIIHGHFYQPPRENPWTGKVERQAGAAPYHDWNERIFAECYQANASANIGGDVPEHRVNNYSKISFNFGPTLLSWLETNHLDTYKQIILADQISQTERGGHGNAIAQAYGHAILPLCNDRDRVTQIVWGLEDFRYRFGREPESLWLPETACNDEVLSLLIDQRLRYVILAPEQAERVRATADAAWRQVESIDTTRPYLYRARDGSGRSLAIFFYNGPLSRAIAFEHALSSSRGLVDKFLAVARFGPLVNVATDGETYGHHFKFGDLCLAHALEVEAKQSGLAITNYGEYLDNHQPTIEVGISNGPLFEGSSWSCAHGVGRWTRDCGCHTGGEPGWNQHWRAPLRAALNFLRDDAATHFENLGREFFWDPWQARNEYIRLLLDQQKSRDWFFTNNSRRPLSDTEQNRALLLLEIQRNSLLMFTSCGWFFSDLAGLETVQIMRYAARLIQLGDALGLPTQKLLFLEMLAEAKSNRPEKGNGADIFLSMALPQPEVGVPETTAFNS